MRKTRGKSCFLNLGRHATEWSCDVFTFYQPAAHESHSWLILRLLYIFCVCLSVCVGLCITCATITSHTLLACDFTLVDLGKLL